MSASWATLMGGIRYGYKPFYLLELEGIPVLFSEVGTSPREGGEPTADTRYTLDASLIIDDSARIGSVVDEATHIAKGFDLTVRLLNTPAVRDLMKRPTVQAVMTADLAVSGSPVTIEVESTRGFSYLPKPQLYYGFACSDDSWGSLFTSFVGVQSALYGPGRSYRAGTVVADRPTRWKGRRARLYMAMLDPLGRAVQWSGSSTPAKGDPDIFGQACVIWEGHVIKRPEKDGATWTLQCRDQVRRLTQPLGIEASGKASWALDDDAPRYVQEDTTFAVLIQAETGPDPFCNVVARPFAGQAQPIGQAKIRKLIADALKDAYDEVVTDAPGSIVGTVLRFDWRCILTEGATKRTWQLVAFVDTDGTIGDADKILFRVQATGNIINAGLRVAAGQGATISMDWSSVECVSTLYMDTQVIGTSLSVVLKDGVRYSALPSAGWLMLEAEGKADYYRYLSKAQDEADYRRVLIELEPGATTGSNVNRVAADELAGEAVDVSATFFWRDTGKLKDVLRRSIASSGEGANGTYDTLPKGQGYDIEYTDVDSFDDAFDGAYLDLDFDVAVKGGSTFAKLFGGLLRLSQRAIVTRRRFDGGVVNIAAISIGSPDGIPVATITESQLVALDKRRPVRKLRSFVGPVGIDVTLNRLPVGSLPSSEGTLEYNADHLTDWTDDRWDIDVHGIGRSAIEDAASVWARAWFRGGENRQIIEIDIPPWIDVQCGDIVMVELTDPTVFDYAVGEDGLTALARVLGAQLSLTTGVTTLTVQVDGVNTPGPMSPSIPILAVNGSDPEDPDSIDVDAVYSGPLAYAKGAAASWRLLAYQPGNDSGDGLYTVTDITDIGGGMVRLTVTASPTSPPVSLDTTYRLTWPIEDECTDEQNRFLHTSHRVQWS